MSFANLPNFLTVPQTAHELHCHPDTVTALVRRGELTAVRLGRAVRIVTESIAALAQGAGSGVAAGKESGND